MGPAFQIHTPTPFRSHKPSITASTAYPWLAITSPYHSWFEASLRWDGLVRARPVEPSANCLLSRSARFASTSASVGSIEPCSALFALRVLRLDRIKLDVSPTGHRLGKRSSVNRPHHLARVVDDTKLTPTARVVANCWGHQRGCPQLFDLVHSPISAISSGV